MNAYIAVLLKIAGYFQVALCIGSLAIPRLLNWKGELGKVSVIIAQMFWTYAGYILVINFCFGLISVIGAHELLEKTLLSKSITIFIFLYWFARVLIQFFYFDTKSAPQGLVYKLGEIALVSLFVFLTAVYAIAAFANF